jgi:hypothetical protein
LSEVQGLARQVVTFSISFRGQLGPKTKIQYHISFTPELAEVVVATLVLNIENEEPRVFKLSGIGKYPFLQLNTSKLNFESLLIGSS